MKTETTVKLTALALATALTTLSTAAFAQKSGGDGVIAIDQTKAQNGAVTPGDSAGFPVTISQNGSYRLTSDLVVPAGLNGIVVAANVNAVIDLNGFSIVGPGNCSRTVNCFQSGGTKGVLVNGGQVQISGGTVRGFTGYGVGMQQASTARVILTDMFVMHNGVGAAAAELKATRVTAEQNYVGLSTAVGTIADCNVSYNGAVGISIQHGVVRHSTIAGNAYGLQLFSGTLVVENVLYNNSTAPYTVMSFGTPTLVNNSM